ncbi:MAG: metal ABC transporter solute-binding protein, Zn/Mn family [Flavobacteriales bacterium]
MTKRILLGIISVFSINCQSEKHSTTDKLKVVTTTTLLTDLLKNIGGEAISIEGLMGSGVDPHLYKASERDASKLFNSDIIFYNGLHLEGKLESVFEKMKHQNKTIICVSDAIHKNKLISSKDFSSNYDPHIWFNIDYWKQISLYVVEQLQKKDPKNASIFEKNGQKYLKKLQTLGLEIQSEINTLPKKQRILVTAHDAFNYFGKAYHFNVMGLQGLSTNTEAGVYDVQKLSQFIIDHKVKAIFIESSVSKKTMEALQKAVESKGYKITIGGTLYSDALGNTGTIEGTYIGMYQHNVKTIIKALQ